MAATGPATRAFTTRWPGSHKGRPHLKCFKWNHKPSAAASPETAVSPSALSIQEASTTKKYYLFKKRS